MIGILKRLSDLMAEYSVHLVWALVFVLLGLYFVWFGLILGGELAKDPARWGELGDFVGGIANPIVAVTALFWLFRSVEIQKKELAETREELQKAALAQQQQVNIAGYTARLSAIEQLLRIREAEHAQALMQLESLEDRQRRTSRPELLMDLEHEILKKRQTATAVHQLLLELRMDLATTYTALTRVQEKT